MTVTQQKHQDSNQLLIPLLILQVLLSIVIVWRVIRLESLLVGNRENVSYRFEDLPIVDDIPYEGHPSRGPIDAGVLIVEFIDYECVGCRESQKIINELLSANEDKIRFIHFDFPLPIHDHAFLAAKAARCAERQDSFWSMNDSILTYSNPVTSDALRTMASEIGLNLSRYDQCLIANDIELKIQNDIEIGEQYGVYGTPTYFINGRKVQGVISIREWQGLVDGAIRDARD